MKHFTYFILAAVACMAMEACTSPSEIAAGYKKACDAGDQSAIAKYEKLIRECEEQGYQFTAEEQSLISEGKSALDMMLSDEDALYSFD